MNQRLIALTGLLVSIAVPAPAQEQPTPDTIKSQLLAKALSFMDR